MENLCIFFLILQVVFVVHPSERAKLYFKDILWIVCLKILQQSIYHRMTESRNGPGWKRF